jgi:hypothetical protein
MQRDLNAALSWIISVLSDAGIPFQFVGGLAARAHGATRDLVDLDLYVPDADLSRVAELGGEFLKQPPVHHVDEHWDLTFLKFSYGGWVVEVAGADSAKVWTRLTGQWTGARIDFESPKWWRFAGLAVPVMPLDQLVEYKRGLGRPVDIADLHEITLDSEEA